MAVIDRTATSAIDVSVVIPVYRSARTLSDLTHRLLAVLDDTGLRNEVIFVDDGSPDSCWQTLSALQGAYPDRIVIIQLMRNYGQHNALMCGFRHVRGAYVITMDDDLQHPPEEIPKLLAAIQTAELDLVYGCAQMKSHSNWRNAGSALINCFYRLAFNQSVTITAFRIIRRELVQSILSYSKNFTFIDGLLAWNTQRIGQVQVEHCPRAHGRSSYSLPKLVILALNLFTNFSLLPLQLISGCGLIAASGGFILGLFYLIHYFLSHITVPGYASTIIATLILGGTQLLALGIMGEYLGRLHLNVNRKPQYVERQVIAALPQAASDALPQKEAA